MVSLSLPSYGLTGTLSTAIGDLTFLRMLNLSSNRFRGEVPATIVRLAHLQALDLSYNAFTEFQSCDSRGHGAAENINCQKQPLQ